MEASAPSEILAADKFLSVCASPDPQADLAAPDPDRLAALCAETGCWPSAAIAAFRW